MYIAISFSHQNTNVSLREKLHFSDEESLEFLPILHTIEGVSEVILLSTCNRCEIYAFLEESKEKHFTTQKKCDEKKEYIERLDSYKTDSTQIHFIQQGKNYQEQSLQNKDSYNISQIQNITENNHGFIQESMERIIESLAKFKSIHSSELDKIAIIQLQNHAIHHIFCVASSLLSVVVGETQISGQLKHAYKLSYDNNFCAKALTRLIHFAFRCAASVRSRTDISKNPISVASVAVNLALEYINIQSCNAHNNLDSVDSHAKNPIINCNNIPQDDSSLQLSYTNQDILQESSYYQIPTNNTNNVSKSLTESHRTNNNCKILIIGVGEMGVLCLKHLLKHSVHLTLCNRTHANAQKILDDLGVHHVELLDFSLLQENIYKYDIVLSAVAGGAILTQDMLLMNLKQGHGLNKNIQKKIFFDLSIPRNFSFDTNSLKDSGIYNLEVIGVDDLKIKAQQHIHLREESAREAMGIVGKFTLDFSHWLSSLGVDPLIKTMRTQAKQASLKEINRAIKKGFIPEALRDNVTKLAHSIFNEFLHAPTIKLKSMAEDENSDAILESIANLFGTQDRILLNRYKCEYDNETK